MKSSKTRREFFGESSCAAIGSASILSTLLNLKVTNQAAAAGLTAGDDCKTLVCIYLNGGNDSYNMLLRRDAGYSSYANSRTNLALSQAQLQNTHLNQASGGDGNLYALHPSCSKLVEMFNGAGNDGFSGKRRLSFVANVGTLIERTSANEVTNGTAPPLPQNLFSHIDQFHQWQTSVPQGLSELTGWGGRMADVLHSSLNTQATSMSISLAGNNVFQIGNNTQQFTITQQGALLLEGGNTEERRKNDALDGILSQTYRNLMREAFSRQTGDSIEAQIAFKAIFDNFTLPNDFPTFPNTRFARELRVAAISIAIRQQLGLRRSTIFVSRSGWDHHGELLNNHSNLLTEISDAIHAYQLALESLGVAQDVISYTASDFGRTLRSNGRGTDHAWGGCQMIFGEPVDGGKVYGTFPNLALNSSDDLGRGGRLVPTTSIDEVHCELARWFGINNSDLTYVLPNIGNFVNNVSTVDQILGFVKNGRIS